ncbi:MAG: zinc-binding dehydrogenase [Bacteroidetes bacterium]|nr:zinc-binding dehydrogenase [Bacteroidota bacterium]
MPTLPQKMRILEFEAPHRPVWKESDVPMLEPDEVLLRVLGITTCPHWDLHMMDGEPMFPGAPLDYPLTPGQPGHEAVGEVVAVGKDVKEFTPGMHVAAWRDPGNRRMGLYAQFAPVKAEDLIQIDPKLKQEEIASLELAMCVQGSFDLMRQRNAVAGKHLAVGGLGPSGLIAVQLARVHGAKRIIGLDPLPDRRQMALDLGADEVHDPAGYQWPAGRGAPNAFDSALDTTGLPPAIEPWMNSTRETVAVFGVLRDEVRFGPEQWWGGFALLGYATHTRAAAEEAYRLILERKLTLTPLVTDRLPFSLYAEGVERLRSKKAVKILFDPWI